MTVSTPRATRNTRADAKHPLAPLDNAGRLLADTAHDLRAPLATTRELIQLVLDGCEGPVNGNQHEHLQSAVARCQEMERLIGDMLEFDRARSALPRIRRQRVSPGELIDGVIAVAQGPARQREIQLGCYGFDRSTPAVWADGDKIRRLLVNLTMNALKATPEGGQVMLSAAAGVPARTLRLSVTDTGSGITDGCWSAGADRGVRVPGGLGLGLSICGQLAALHHTRLHFAVREQGGTEAAFELPLDSPAAAIETLLRWRSTELGEAEPSESTAEALTMAADVRPPQVSGALTAVAVELPSAPAVLADRADALLQSDGCVHELVYRWGTGRWLLLWDALPPAAAARIRTLEDRWEQRVRDDGWSEAARLSWTVPMRVGLERPADQTRLRELVLRMSWQREMGEVLADATPPAPEAGGGIAEQRLGRELQSLAKHLRRRQALLERQARG